MELIKHFINIYFILAKNNLRPKADIILDK